MKVIGRMINNMVKVLRHGMRDPDMKELMRTAKKKALENINGQMVQFMKENGWIIKYLAKVFIFGKMEGDSMENGLIMICKALVFTSGQMEEDMKDSF